MKLLMQSPRSSPFRRRHPTAEEIVEEVYRRVQEQQEQQQQISANRQWLSKIDSLVEKVPPTTPTTTTTTHFNHSHRGGISGRSVTPRRKLESRSDCMAGQNVTARPTSDSRQRNRSITPFRRRKNITKDSTSSSLDVTQLVAEYTSTAPKHKATIARASTTQSTTFLPVGNINETNSQRQSNASSAVVSPHVGSVNKNMKEKSQNRNPSPWNAILRKKSSGDTSNTTYVHGNITRQHQSNAKSIHNNSIPLKSNYIVDPPEIKKTGRTLRSQNVSQPSSPVKSRTSKARSVSPFFRRRHKEAFELIADAKRNAMELARLQDEPSPSRMLRENRSRSGIIGEATEAVQPNSPKLVSPTPKARRVRSLSPFTRRRKANELISDAYQQIEIDFSERTASASSLDDAVEIVLGGIAPIVSPNLGFRRKREKLSSDYSTTVNVLCSQNPGGNSNDESGTTNELQTIATVLLEAPLNNNGREETSVQRNNKSIHGRKSILVSKNNPKESRDVSTKPADDLNKSDSTKSTDLNVTTSPGTIPRRRTLIQRSKFGSRAVKDPKNARQSSPKKKDTPSPAIESELIPPSSIVVNGRSRVSELSVSNATQPTTAIPITSKVKTRSLGDRSLAEIQTALEKVQLELSGATKGGQTIPRDLVMEKLLAVAETIEAPDDRHTFLRKLSRLSSTILSESSKDGGTTSGDSDSSDEDDTDNLDTSGDESSFSRWATKRRDKKDLPSTGQWTKILDALGFSGLWDDDMDMEDLDLSRGSTAENDDNLQTDDETLDRPETPPITPKLSFTELIGQITSPFRGKNVNEEVQKMDEKEQNDQRTKAHAEAVRRKEIDEEEQMLRELEEMDEKIRTERRIRRTSLAAERLKTLAVELRKENEKLDRNMAENDDAPDDRIEMYVQELPIHDVRALESERMKQHLVDSVIQKVKQDQLLKPQKEALDVGNDISHGVVKSNNATRSLTDSALRKVQYDHSTSNSTNSSTSAAMLRATNPVVQKNQVNHISTPQATNSATRADRTEDETRKVVNAVSRKMKNDEISMTHTTDTSNYASLVSQPEPTLSSITSRTGYTSFSGPSHLFHSGKMLNSFSIKSNQDSNISKKTNALKTGSTTMSNKKTNASRTNALPRRTIQSATSSTKRQSWNMGESQREAVSGVVTFQTTLDSNYDSYEDALSVGSIESHQFASPVGGQSSHKMYTFRLADEERSNVT